MTSNEFELNKNVYSKQMKKPQQYSNLIRKIWISWEICIQICHNIYKSI